MSGSSPTIHVWNVHEGVVATVGSQRCFNVVGRIDDAAETVALDARLNHGSWFPVPVNLAGRPKARLRSPGDFNIDTIAVKDLAPTNVLELRQELQDGSHRHRSLTFKARHTPAADTSFELQLGAGEVEEFCQVVDGHWRIKTDEDGPALSVDRNEAGYDRIVLFGDRRWTTGYEIDACLSVDEWTHYVHNVGLLFKWNNHAISTDRSLPSRWSTGLAYYASVSPGLRLRFGVDVTYSKGERHGDHVLDETPRTRWTRRPLWLLRACWYATRGRWILSQLRTGVRYRFLAEIDPACYTLTVWPDGQPRPATPQLTVPTPREMLEAGSVGVIAQNAAVRVHQFVVRSTEVATDRHDYDSRLDGLGSGVDGQRFDSDLAVLGRRVAELDE